MSSQFVWLLRLPCLTFWISFFQFYLPRIFHSPPGVDQLSIFFGSTSSIQSLWPHHPSLCFLVSLSSEVTCTSSHNELPTTNQSDQLKVCSEIDSWNRMLKWERKGWGRTLQFLQFTQWLTQRPPECASFCWVTVSLLLLLTTQWCGLYEDELVEASSQFWPYHPPE